MGDIYDPYDSGAPSGIYDPYDSSPASVPQMQRGNLIDAVVEPVLSLGSAMIAKPAGGIAGLVKGWHDTQRRWAGLGQWGPNAEETQQAVQHAIQYQPTTQVGASKLNPLNAIPAAIGGAIGLLQPDAVTGPESTTLGGSAQNALREAIPQAIGIAGVKYGPGATNAVGQAAKRGAQATMVNAIKATPTEIMSGDAALAAQELLKRGINPNTAGVVELNKIIEDLHGQVESTIAGSTASASKQAVIDSLQRVKDTFMYKPNLPANQARIAAAGQEFADHPLLPTDAIPVQVAQKLKRGYQKSVAEDYGVESTAGLEANKQIAQSLRQQIEQVHPEVAPLNAEQASLLDALKVVQRRAAMNQNEGLVPHVSPLGGPVAQTAMVLNRNPWLRANLAQGLNKIGNLLSREPALPPGTIPYVRPPKAEPLSNLAIAPEPQGLDYSSFAKDYRAKQAMEAGAPDTLIARTQAANSERAAAQDWLQGQLEAQRRRPASSGMPMDLDPITGRLRPADAGLRGATPATVESTGNNLASATEKLSSGRAFSMSAEERLAWNARKAELAQAAPELRGLSDSAIAGKIADRQWVATRIEALKTEYADWAKAAGEKFRAEQAAALNERANTPAVMSGAERTMRKVMNSEASRRMKLAQETRRAEMQAKIDALEGMSESLAGPRPGTAIDLGQGPKTRGALRDLLTP